MLFHPSPETPLPELLPDPYTQRATLFIACQHCALEVSQKHAFCLHDLSLSALINVRQQNCQSIVATRGDCLLCVDSPYPKASRPRVRLEEKLESLNTKLREREISGMVVHWLDEPSWLAQQQAAKTILAPSNPPQASPPSRRHFFQQWFPKK